MLLLDPAQLAEQVVVVRIRDLRVVEDVVPLVVVRDLPPELLGSLLGPLRCAHRWVVASESTGDSAAASIPAKSHSLSRSRLGRSVRSKCTGVTEIRSLAMADRSEPGSSSKEGSKP